MPGWGFTIESTTSHLLTELVQLLLEKNDVNPNVLGYDKQTALSLASQRGKVRVVNQLLGHGDIHPNQADSR